MGICLTVWQQVQEAGISALPLTSWPLSDEGPPVLALLPTGGSSLAGVAVCSLQASLTFYFGVRSIFIKEPMQLFKSEVKGTTIAFSKNG